MASRFQKACAGLFLSASLLAGCSGLPEPQYPPAPLPEFERSAQLERVWRDHSGAGEGWRGYRLTPILQDELLISVDAQGWVQTFDRERRRLLWSYELPSGASASPVLAEGRLYITTQNADLFALDPQTGAHLWQVRLPSEALSPVAVQGDLLAVLSGDGRVSAFHAETGRALWTYDSLMPSLTLRGSASPLITPIQVYVGLANGKLVSLDRRTGQLRWEAQVAQPQGRTDIERLVDLDGTPVLHQNVLYVTSFQGQTQALDAFTGRPRWSRDLSSYHAPLRIDRQLIVVDEASRVYALDLATGRTLWMQEDLFGRQLTAPVALGSTLVVADYQGFIHLIDAASGRIIGRQSFDLDGIQSTPRIDQDYLLVHSHRGRLGLFRLKKD
ncbi:outer membrane protein assembly factor BamB [Marinospirillum sp. MEB164]|uniref:Outer membrane protein assembly factor BamB n=1 Tax=Marinospirillum alkalitolerans TaxID=3123374 RepID=A0ABW8PXV9_9GAMM